MFGLVQWKVLEILCFLSLDVIPQTAGFSNFLWTSHQDYFDDDRAIG